MAKHAAIAYALWLVGSWVGLHHLYLHRPRAAFLTTVTLNGWGVGWLRDLLAIPQLVAHANASDEYKEKMSVDKKFNSQPPMSLLVAFVQYVVATLFGSIASSLLPKGVPEIVYEMLYVVGAAFGVTFAGDALNLETEASARWVFATVALVAVPAFGYYGFDSANEDYLYFRTASIIVGCVVYVLTRRWATTTDAAPSSKEASSTKTKSKPSYVKTLLKYWAMLGLFVASTVTALMFHGDVRVEVNGVEVDTPFFEAFTNFLQSEAVQKLSSTLQDLYNGKSYEERFEQRWQRFNVDMDLSGRFRYLKVLGLPRNATEKEIKAAYRRLVLQWHPDKYTGEDKEHANAMFYKIQEAYEKLVETQNDEKAKRAFGSSDEL